MSVDGAPNPGGVGMHGRENTVRSNIHEKAGGTTPFASRKSKEGLTRPRNFGVRTMSRKRK